MDTQNTLDNSEKHPLFPSGDWEGFFTYTQGPNAFRNKMDIQLFFQENKVTGGGSDEVGSFTWEGQYDTSGLWCNLIKFYATHRVFYQGQVDENGIWGSWEIPPFSRGGFHIWPKKKGEEDSLELEESLSLSDIISKPIVVNS